MREGQLYINEQPVPKERVEDIIDDREDGSIRRIKRYRETLPNGVSYYVLDEREGDDLDDTGVYTVPDDHYFMMGDNRDNSRDSRVLNGVGYIPFDHFVGRASFLFFSHNGSARFWEVWKWWGALRTERFFTWVQSPETPHAEPKPQP